MPLTDKGQEILGSMKKTYGDPEKAKQVLYASANKGTISGIHDAVEGMGGGSPCGDQDPAPAPPSPAPPMPDPPAPPPAARDVGMVTAPNAALPMAKRSSMGFGGGKDRGAFGSQSFNGAFKGRSV